MDVTILGRFLQNFFSLYFHQIFITLCDLGIQLLLLFLVVLNLQAQRSIVRSLVILYRICVLFGGQGTDMVNFDASC